MHYEDKFFKFTDLKYKVENTNWGWYYYDSSNKMHGPFAKIDEMIDHALKIDSNFKSDIVD